MSKKSLSEVFGGLILLALGITFLLEVNYIIPSGKWWVYFLIALGGIFLLDAFLRSRFLRDNFFGGRFFTAIILLLIGFSLLFHLKYWWPFILIVIGVLITLKGLLPKKLSAEEKKDNN